MKTTIDSYPFFDANQVLTKDHLNRVVEYLDEQERLTRANLVGIGISCGLDPKLDNAAGWVSIAKGCAVTSLGYLLIEQDDVTLTGYREFKLPEGDRYDPFKLGSGQLPLWELFPEGAPNVTKLYSPANFLEDKSVLLFLENNKEDLSDCSPNNCDDKGKEVTVTLRRLLVSSADVAQISEKLRAEADDSARLELPDLRLHRYDAPRTGPVTTRDVLEAFQAVVQKDHLVTAAKEALAAAYDAFKPILLRAHPSNPFDGFMGLYGFLESAPVTPRQVTFLPYYMDLFSDLLAAYEEFRKRGLELACLCGPPEDWFPRHMVLGPEQRTGWHPSTASCCGCEDLRHEVRLLFTRLVEITRRFGNNPALRESSLIAAVDEHVRITPSRAGTAPLSARCIPYYYDLKGTPPLYRLWNPALTRQGRAHHNQGYRSNEYSPQAPAFVETPLSFDLEPFDFLRIEGHLGKDYRAVLARLESMRASFRLPFDVVAVRTGPLDESLEVDPAEHACRFQDLEAAYKALREELSCLAKKSMALLGSYKLTRPLPSAPRLSTLAASVSIPLSGVTSVMGLNFAEVAKQLKIEAGTIGAAFLDNAKLYGPEDLTLIGESAAVNAALSVLNKLAYLTSLLAQDLHSVDGDEFEKTVRQLKKLSEAISKEGSGDATEGGLTWQELNRQIVSVVFACRLEGFLAIRDEYLRRLQQIRKLAYFEGYVQEHPALQHKAGVPVGGTFVIVYHGGSGREPQRGDTYASAIQRLAEGTVIADFCLPYQCCSDCAPIQFVLGPSEAPPVEAPRITAELGCTDAESQADVEVTATGGRPPYKLSVDDVPRGESFPALIRLKLAAGTHTLQVTDDDEVAGAPIRLEVPEALTTGTVEYTDDTTARTFTASFRVTGGVRPYKAGAGLVLDDLVTVERLPSGTTMEVRITDWAGCSTRAAIQHAVAGCDKPCNGKATRIRYPAWAPDPAKTVPYQYRTLKSWRLEVADENGNASYSGDLTEAVRTLIEGRAINGDTYVQVMSRVCAVVSDTVAAALPREYGPGAFVIEYERERGTLRIESYSCHTFRIEIEFALLAGDFLRTERWRYGRDGIRVEQRADSESVPSYFMPAFGRIDLDKCTNEVGTDCTVDLRGITLRRSHIGLLLTPSFGEGVDARRLEYHWRVDGPSLAYSNGSEFPLPVNRATGVMVQLLVIDKKGCWAFLETSIDPRGTPIRSGRRRR